MSIRVGFALAPNSTLWHTSQEGIEEFSTALAGFETLPGHENYVNDKPSDDDMMFLRRNRDSKVFRIIHNLREQQGTPFQATRASFPQGKSVTENSGIRRYSHTQIAVLDPNCILGWFMPPGAVAMIESEYETAQLRRDLMREAILQIKRGQTKP